MLPLSCLAVTLLLGACSSAPVRESSAPAREDEAILQFVDIRNESPEPVIVTARVGATREQDLGTFDPSQFRRVTISTAGATTDEIFLRARNPQTGREATTTLQAAPGQTLQWAIRF